MQKPGGMSDQWGDPDNPKLAGTPVWSKSRRTGDLVVLGREARQGGGTEGFQFGDRGGRSGEALGSSPVSRRPPDVGLLDEEQAGADGAEAVALGTRGG